MKQKLYVGDTSMQTEILRASRALQRLTQKELAAKIGVSESHYCKIERGYVEPTALEKLKIQEVLGPTINQVSSVFKG
jgi:transcriptional regulator with XRE-family HTH domain